MSNRVVEPEILDSLSVDDPRAIANRRDLSYINFLMGNFRWIARQIKKSRITSWVEIGAGRGELACFLEKKNLLESQCYDAIDLCPAPHNLPDKVNWYQADLLDNKSFPSASGCIANLILHQFTDEQLKIIQQKIQAFDFLIINEPVRHPLHQWQFKLCKLLGFNDVSMHDGRVSINAGFLGEELPNLLALSKNEWDFSIQTTFLGGYRLFAQKRK